MLFYTHLVIGLLFSLLSVKFFNISDPVFFISIAIISSALPDLDHPKSKFGRYFRFLNFLLEHRGFFHSLLVLPLIALILYYFNYSQFAFPIIVGYLSHLVGDALTLEGIMPFHPISRFRIKGFIRTGGFLEIIFFIALLVLAGYILL